MNAELATNQVSLPPLPKTSPAVQQIVDKAVKTTLECFADQKLAPAQLAVTLVDLAQPGTGSYRGAEQVYPASVIKLFYLDAVHRWMEDGRIQDGAELRRAMRDMIVDSYNEATGYIVDLLTDTTSGPELSPEEMATWYHKRNEVNRYFAGLGFEKINANRKPWCEGPYGREMQSVKMHAPNHRNWLTTDATARLLAGIALGQAVSPERSAQMLDLLKRDLGTGTGNSQAQNYTGIALPTGAKLWSKAGWTSQTRHDAAYVELPGGVRFVLVTFTVDHADTKDIIATVARVVVEEMSKSGGLGSSR
ncbi:MAG TPA: serine hydrolase [Clostridia bacterium]|nr:serine hydrolase [Clostridia bacterium]